MCLPLLHLTAGQTSSTTVASTLALRGSRTFQSLNGGAQSVSISCYLTMPLLLMLAVCRRQSLHHLIFRQARSDFAFAGGLIKLPAFASTLTPTSNAVFSTVFFPISGRKHESFSTSQQPCAGFPEPKFFSGCKVFSRRSQQLRCSACGQRGHLQAQEERGQDCEYCWFSAERTASSSSCDLFAIDASKGSCVSTNNRLVACSQPCNPTDFSKRVSNHCLQCSGRSCLHVQE